MPRSPWYAMFRDRLQRRRPVGVFVVTGITVVALIIWVVALFVPLLGVIATLPATTVGVLRVPVGSITAVTIIGGIITVLVLIAGALRRHTVLTVLLAILAFLIMVAVTAFPIFAVTLEAAGRAGDFWTTLHHVWTQITG